MANHPNVAAPPGPRAAPNDPAGDALAAARAAAAACGVTRLADITGLDRVGVPVFQAVRPLSRALSVHQGKGLTVVDAQLGALMEACESAHAETFDAQACVSAWNDLPRAGRPACLPDFAAVRGRGVGADEPIAWTRVERLRDGAPALAPFECVSLDCARPWDRRLDRCSNGLGARFEFEGAVMKGLLEVLERDGVGEWRRLTFADRAITAIDTATIPHAWYADLTERLADLGVYVSLYAVPVLGDLPAIFAEVVEPAVFPAPRALVGGWACGLSAEAALRGAVLEALQSRLTLIAGARDDLFYDHYERPFAGEGCPLPPNLRGLDWDSIAERDDDGLTVWGLAERLAAAGYPDVAAVRLSPPESRICVAKVLAPGLGANRRRRRRGSVRRLH